MKPGTGRILGAAAIVASVGLSFFGPARWAAVSAGPTVRPAASRPVAGAAPPVAAMAGDSMAVPASSDSTGRAAAEVRLPVQPGVLPVAAPAASAPSLIFYQGRLTDASGTPRTGYVSLSVSLYDVASGGTALWSETHSPVPLTDGVFGVLLGGTTTFPVDAWTESDRWLGIAVDGEAEMSPRLQVASVPFAIEAARLGGKKAADFDPAGAGSLAAIGLASQLNGSDASPPNVGSNQVHWNNLYGMPAGFADNVDDVGTGVTVHGQLSGLDADDHPQYVLGAELRTSDGTPPNTGANNVHWDILGGVPQPLVTHLLPGSWIAAGAIDSSRVAAGGLAGSNLAPGSIAGSRLAVGAVGPDQVAAKSLTGGQLKNSSLTGDQIENGSLTGVDIQDKSIYTNDIANSTILAVNISPGAIVGALVADETLTGAKIQEGSVAGSRLQENSIPGDRLAAGAVGARELAANAVTGDNVQTGSLRAAHVADMPGLGFRTITGFVDTVASEWPRTVASLTIQAPGAGTVLVTASTRVYLLHDTGSAALVMVGLSTLTDDIPDSTSALISLPASYSSDLYVFTLQTEGVFPVTGAGPVTFHLAAKKGTQSRDPSLHDVRLRAVYLPKLY